MKQRSFGSASGVGRTSLLVIFSVLCLMMLALLSLNTVLAQKRLSERSLESISAYYAADLEAQTLFARLRQGETIPEVALEGDLYRYSCPISAAQTLHVTLRKNPNGWTVLRWQAEAHPEAAKDTLPVWTGTDKEETP